MARVERLGHGEEPGVGPAGADYIRSGPPRAGVAAIGRLIAVDVDPQINVAASETHAHERARSARVPAGKN